MQNQFLIICLFFYVSIQAQDYVPVRLSPQEYITAYKDIAILEMNRTGIPASIKMAQGMLESGFGNSELARKANNHFGLKATWGGWKGEKMMYKGVWRRVYKDADQSFKDHSEFLMKIPRYKFLFRLGKTEYEAWAIGLEKAKYAVAPSYAEHIIDLIERYGLNVLDR